MGTSSWAGASPAWPSRTSAAAAIRATSRACPPEKGLNRIKLYDARGAFVGVVAGPDHLVKDLDLARRACADCHIGFGFDVACDAAGRIYALDPATRDIRIFTPKAVAA